jgi:hypothetical protein
MRRFAYIPAALLLMQAAASATPTQSIPKASIVDTVIGWMRIHEFTGDRKPMKVDDKVYSPAQLSFGDAFAKWIQASYVPKGGLGEVRLFVSDKLGPYSQTDAALPQTYGATA